MREQKDDEICLTDAELNFDEEMYINSLKKISDYDINQVICYHGGIYKKNVNENIKKLTH